MALGAESDPELKLAFQDIRELRVEVAYPLLLELYQDYFKGILSKADFAAALRLIESYVFRRAICSIPTNSLNKTFATFTRLVDKSHYLESFQAHLLLLPSYRRFPTDDEFHRDLQTRDLYNFPRRSYWLRRIENYGRKERVIVDEYTIEHIMPQNESMSAAWRTSLGKDWHRIQSAWLHTLGNLTLTRYNSEYSDHSFQRKRDMEGGFKMSPLKLNAGLGQLDDWNEDAIRARAENLARMALIVWDSPKLPADVMNQYAPSTGSTIGYSLADHPHLLSNTMNGLFEAFRREVLVLDPCVSEEILKFYIAYKAETNFVDVYPQAKRLRLILNLGFQEVSDPLGKCKDMTGNRLNGEVEVGLASLEDLPYVMGLIRQSYERQMGIETNT